MLAAIVRWALERPRLIALACVWFLIWGVMSARGVGFDLLPDLAPAELTIQTDAPGLVSEQVENLVTRPIETTLIGAPGLGRVQSQSVQGLSTITVRLANGADPRAGRAAVSERLLQLAGSLPPGVATPRIAPLTPQDAQVMSIGFTSDKLDPMALRDLVQWRVRPRLMTASGVAEVAVYGGQTRRIEVQARPGDLSDSDLGFLDILNAVKRATGVAGAGFIDTDNQRVSIEPRGQTLTPDDVGAGQIQNASGAPVRINDVADVVEAPAPAFGDALIQGKPGVLVVVKRQYGANLTQTTKAVEQALAALGPSFAAQSVAVHTDLDRPAAFVAATVRGISFDLVIAAILIVVALLLFLRNLSATLISLVSIPLSLVAAVLTLKAFGWTLNAMSLGGLAIALGVVIDDAVIDVENVLSRLSGAASDGRSKLQAVLAASLEVRGPVVYATLAVIVALLPILFVQGQAGALLAPLATAIIAASLASLLVALVVTPALCLLFLDPATPSGHADRLARLRTWQGACAERLGGNPLPVLVGVGLLALLAAISLVLARPRLLPSVPDGHLVVQVTAPASVTIPVMRAYGAQVTAALADLRGVQAISQRIGRDPTGDDSWGTERSDFDLELKPGLDGPAQVRLAHAVADRMRGFPGLNPVVLSRFDRARDDAPSAAPVEVTLVGEDLDALEGAAGQVAAVLAKLPGARGVHVESTSHSPVVRVDINFQRLALYGLSAADVLDTIQAAFEGERVGRIYQDGRVVDLAVSAQTSLRRDPEAVGRLLLRSTSGFSVKLSSVANVYLADDLAMIAHDGGLRRLVIVADPANPARFADQAQAAIGAKVKLPPGAFVEIGGVGRGDQQARNALLFNGLMAMLAVAGLLAIAFDGRTGALILGSTLYAFIGAAAAVVMLGGSVSVGAMVGLVALFGISVRGAILLFARLESLVLDEHVHWSTQVVIRAAAERLAPMLMTTLLVALALAPLAFQAGGPGREILGPMSIVVLCGLATGILGGLFLQPALIYMLWRPAYARRARRHAAHDVSA
jgi:CzcA family heavy metal efflux pump